MNYITHNCMFNEYYQHKLQAVPINQQLKQQLASQLSAPRTLRSIIFHWLTSLSLMKKLSLVSTSLAGTAIAVAGIIYAFYPSQSVSAEELLRLAADKAIPSLTTGQVYYIQAQKTSTDQPSSTIRIWFDGKNIRTEESKTNGTKKYELARLATDGYTLTHYTYTTATPDVIQQYSMADMALVQANKINPPTSADNAMLVQSSNEGLFGDDLVNLVFSPDFRDLSSDITVELVGEEVMQGTTVYKINIENNIVGEHKTVWIDKVNNRLVRTTITLDHNTTTITYLPGEITTDLLLPNYFTIEQWQDDYNLVNIPIQVIDQQHIAQQAFETGQGDEIMLQVHPTDDASGSYCQPNSQCIEDIANGAVELTE